jgi:hypothetical protein
MTNLWGAQTRCAIFRGGRPLVKTRHQGLMAIGYHSVEKKMRIHIPQHVRKLPQIAQFCLKNNL